MRSTETTPLVYLYGVVDSARAPALPKSVRPLPRMSRPRAVEAGKRRWLVASDADPHAYAAPAIEAGLRDMKWIAACATAHEGIVEALTRVGTVVPTKLFTLFASEARALAHVARARPKIDRALLKIAGCEEWGVRVLFDPARAARLAAERAQKETRAMTTGAGFLLRKQRVREAEQVSLSRAREEAEALYASLRAIAKDAQERPPVQANARARAVLDAVFLVPRANAARLLRTAKRASPRLVAAGFEVVVSGPWPAYHFVAAT